MKNLLGNKNFHEIFPKNENFSKTFLKNKNVLKRNFANFCANEGSIFVQTLATACMYIENGFPLILSPEQETRN